MRSTSIVAVLLLAGSLLAGCDQLKGNAPPSVVVVDLAAVAKATGHDAVMDQQMEVARADLTGQLDRIATQLEDQLQVQRDQLEEKGDASAEQQFQQLTTQARQQYAQNQALANQRAQQYQAELVENFRNVLQPIAAEIASQRGAGAVFTTDASLFWFDPTVDITDEVIGVVRANSVRFPPTEFNPPASAAVETEDSPDTEK